MTTVAFAHLASLFVLAAVVAIVYSVNMQGWRQVEPVMHGIVRRFLKIIGLLFYLALIVQAMTYAAGHEGPSSTVATGIACVLGGALFLVLFFPQWVFPKLRAEAAAAKAAASSAG